ncbi:uracil-DNA glycosylase [Halopseudomonas aestusnigri]|jgi:uracil-DNA glycosylase|uniref:uracil-DNA glycosylase n=1 Tax=Halopseudomonas TaxID=2901189 RepID=UPI000C44E703|nr:uracil-DNA glycosylase [Halopseudomonas aestusnigri]MAD27794.1 uracil-DNA glycosylase [Pseudomonadales bacterium]HBT57088.1 uracil-DNA glycosylase [Pseudomonas sp.]MAH00899.1 uracil-DNA glycosylase [Pseudomonadales bacterium]MAS65307.1 uracil-DNA glycosylase [Pseudomonadales bacterium]MCC4259400.1 uracil-DNA glycosylase [Halopseudomonas aestusnigri]|tara:strand:- start:41524 stop:42219 length:696 start_codon:yes stop_codon:yes gene_type:complete
MTERAVQLKPDWLDALQGEFAQPYMQQLRDFLQAEKAAGKAIFPPGALIFNALNSTPLDKVRVVIIGQDPYHGPGQAHGLSFSVPPGVRTPPSLRNIFKEINRDLGLPIPQHGCLQSWAEQGVLLLNAVLTVEQGQAGSHARRGWERFTSRVIELVNERCEHCVFLLWGSYAQRKGEQIDRTRHCVLTSVHPSPLSAHRGFIGNGHFSAANDYLVSNGLAPIDWSLPDPPR